jgi:pimeloyl-ACP methyl ester carboxylesterase
MLEYKVYGENNPNVMLLIHGALVTQSMWKYQVKLLKEDFRVITCNLPEHGNSPTVSGAYTVEKLAHELLNLFDFLKIDSAAICGHSLGGMVAQFFTYQYPRRVKYLVLAETAFGTRNSLHEKLMTSFSQLLLRFMSKQQIIALSAKSYGSVKEETRVYLTDEMNRYAKEQILRVMSAALNYRGKAYLRQIEAPTLIMVGEDNKTTHQQARQMKEAIPKAKLAFIPRANHLLNLDNPNDFNRSLKALISD